MSPTISKSRLLNQIQYVAKNQTYHDFMKHRPGTFIHLVKFINAADAIVTQHQSTTERSNNQRSLIYTHRKGSTQKVNWLVNAYVCSTSCRVSGSRVMYAVRPTAEEPLPEVYCPLGTKLYTYCGWWKFEYHEYYYTLLYAYSPKVAHHWMRD